MAETQSRPRLVRFGAFEADVQTGELRKDGVKLKFSGQPFQVLAILLERPGRRGHAGRTAEAALAGHVCRCRAQPQYRRQQDPRGAGRLGGEPALCRDAAAARVSVHR